MDVEKLWEILYRERNTASLQELPERFCEEVRDYISRLERDKEEADETRRGFIEDEIRNARMKVEDIIRRRIGKIIKLASSGIETSPKGMLEDERELFQGVKSEVDEGRARIFARIFGEPEPQRQKNEQEREPERDSGRDRDKGKDKGKDKNKVVGEQYSIVRILENIPTFMGVDGRIYKLGKEDVIMLPKTNAEILCNRGVAMRLEVYQAKGDNKKRIEDKERGER